MIFHRGPKAILCLSMEYCGSASIAFTINHQFLWIDASHPLFLTWHQFTVKISKDLSYLCIYFCHKDISFTSSYNFYARIKKIYHFHLNEERILAMIVHIGVNKYWYIILLLTILLFNTKNDHNVFQTLLHNFQYIEN